MADSEEQPDKSGAGPDPDEERKRKFREALARKQAQHSGQGAGGQPGSTGKVHGSHGPAASKRSFRRKSGS